MNCFLAFYGDQYYPERGLGDLVGLCDTEDGALAICRQKMAEDACLKWAKVCSLDMANCLATDIITIMWDAGRHGADDRIEEKRCPTNAKYLLTVRAQAS